jgi:hypothetical protein
MNKETKKVYTSPKLTQLGDIGQVTQKGHPSSNNNNCSSGGSDNNNSGSGSF